MLALMLDPRYKGLKLVSNYVERGHAIRVVLDYNELSILPLLMIYFKWLNRALCNWASQNTSTDDVEDNNMFGVGASDEESSLALIKGKLSLFRQPKYSTSHM